MSKEKIELVERLTRIKEKVDKAKSDEARLEGKRDEILGRMEDEFEVKSTKAANKKLESMRKEAGALQAELETLVTQLEGELEEMSV